MTNPSKNSLFFYRAELASPSDVYDGDTIKLSIDLGFNSWLKQVKFRLYGINTPEVRGEEKEEGYKSRDFLRSYLVGEHLELYVETYRDKTGKYGRWLATLWAYYSESNNWVNVNKLLVDMGLAEEREY